MSARKVWLAASLVVLLCVTWYLSRAEYRLASEAFMFDDAGMFFRYAMNIRRGFGIAWNPHGPATFGITSLPWLAVIWAASFYSFMPADATYLFPAIKGFLITTSWMFSLGAVLSLVAGGMLEMRSRRVTVALWLFLAIYLPLLMNPSFQTLAADGMETMLAFCSVALFGICCRWYAGILKPAKIALLTIVGVTTVLIRPEAVLIVAGVPLCFGVFCRRSVKAVAWYLVMLSGALGACLVAAKMYFGVAVPLAFFIKAAHAYAGYQPYLDRLAYMANALFASFPAILCCLIFTRRTHLRVLLSYGLPLLATFLYLMTVEQIMGWQGRYYLPFCALLYLAALHVVAGLRMPLTVRLSAERGVAILVALVFCTPLSFPLCTRVATFFVVRRSVYLPPVFHDNAQAPLPATLWYPNIFSFMQVAQSLPAGRTVALSEVGMLGALLPRLNLIDTAGLNDTRLATEGFDVRQIFARQPDLIWMMNPEYSQLAGRFATDPELLSEYDVYASVFDYGVAVRRASPDYKHTTEQLERAFTNAYGNAYKLQDYKVSRVSWDPNAKRAGVHGDIQHL